MLKSTNLIFHQKLQNYLKFPLKTLFIILQIMIENNLDTTKFELLNTGRYVLQHWNTKLLIKLAIVGYNL